MKAIIGGTGVYKIEGSSASAVIEVETPFGTVEVEKVSVEGVDVVFLARHGKGHKVPPHRINYRANMMALKQLGVDEILATCAVGSCHEALAPGELVLINDFLDFTKHREHTYFDGSDGVAHVEVSTPYCSVLQQAIVDEAQQLTLPIYKDAVYVCTEGPRFETAAEIKMFKMLGGDVVGMTNFPEVVLAKELGMCYAAVGFVTNWCTGVKTDVIEMHDIQGSIDQNRVRLTELFLRILSNDQRIKDCTCRNSLIKL